MSEYQYYEFRAVDSPLTATQMKELRALSSRAKITARRFVNEYHYGDFRGDPSAVVRDYFDAHVFTANWGERHFALRFPLHKLPVEAIEPYLDPHEEGLTLEQGGDNWILWFAAEVEYDSDSGDLWMDSLLDVRPTIMDGDCRALYLGWLAAVQRGALDDSVLEPPVPAGLQALPLSHQSLTVFLGLDEDLVAAAAEASPEHGPSVSTGRTVGELGARAFHIGTARAQEARERQEAVERDRPRRSEQPSFLADVVLDTID